MNGKLARIEQQELASQNDSASNSPIPKEKKDMSCHNINGYAIDTPKHKSKKKKKNREVVLEDENIDLSKDQTNKEKKRKKKKKSRENAEIFGFARCGKCPRNWESN